MRNRRCLCLVFVLAVSVVLCGVVAAAETVTEPTADRIAAPQRTALNPFSLKTITIFEDRDDDNDNQNENDNENENENDNEDKKEKIRIRIPEKPPCRSAYKPMW